jgi:hypothetical protein
MLKVSTWVLKVALILVFTAHIARRVEASPIQVGPTGQVAPTGSVTGQVVDQTGAAVPGASVTITNDSSGQVTTTKTDSAGNFTIPNFPVGTASIKVTAKGFRAFQLSGVTVSVGQASTQHIVLPVGSVSETVMDTSTGVRASSGGTGGAQNQAAATQQQQNQVAATQQQHSQGQQLTGSAWGTPDACATGTPGALAAKGILFVHRSLVLPQEATDDFGYRLGKRFLVYQVSVTNASPDFQYSVSDIVVDLKPIFSRLTPAPPLLNTDTTDVPTPATYEASSQDLSMLRGVPEKGQDYDPRNMTLHILQGVGAVGAGISGLTPFSDVMGPAMANFNGAFLQAFTGIAPDHTATQLNRLSDKAFTSNTLIGKLQTKTFAIFIPEQFVMPKEAQKTYWKDPRTELSILPFDQLNVCVDGILLVQAATTPDPTFSTAETLVAPGAQITLADDSSATIYFTTNGDTPTTSSAKYSTPIVIGAVGTPQLTIKAFAVEPNESPSNTVVRSFTPATPAASPIFSACSADNKSVTIAPATPNDTVFYTVDGTAPSRSSNSIIASTTLTISSASEKIQAVEVGNTTSLSQVVSKSCP